MASRAKMLIVAAALVTLALIIPHTNSLVILLVTRIRDGKAERVPVTLGVRQPETEDVEIAEGIAAGDVLIVGSAKNVAGGTAITVIK